MHALEELENKNDINCSNIEEKNELDFICSASPAQKEVNFSEEQ